jgi:hypothetical protein
LVARLNLPLLITHEHERPKKGYPINHGTLGS